MSVNNISFKYYIKYSFQQYFILYFTECDAETNETTAFQAKWLPLSSTALQYIAALLYISNRDNSYHRYKIEKYVSLRLCWILLYKIIYYIKCITCWHAYIYRDNYIDNYNKRTARKTIPLVCTHPHEIIRAFDEMCLRHKIKLIIKKSFKKGTSVLEVACKVFFILREGFDRNPPLSSYEANIQLNTVIQNTELNTEYRIEYRNFIS